MTLVDSLFPTPAVHHISSSPISPASFFLLQKSVIVAGWGSHGQRRRRSHLKHLPYLQNTLCPHNALVVIKV